MPTDNQLGKAFSFFQEISSACWKLWPLFHNHLLGKQIISGAYSCRFSPPGPVSSSSHYLAGALRCRRRYAHHWQRRVGPDLSSPLFTAVVELFFQGLDKLVLPFSAICDGVSGDGVLGYAQKPDVLCSGWECRAEAEASELS